MGSRTSDTSGKLGAIDPKSIAKFGDSASFRTMGKDSPVQWSRQVIKKNKHLDKRGFKEPKTYNYKAFTEQVADEMFCEVIRKKGPKWAIYDDDTEAEIGVFDTRRAARQKQADLRKQKQLAARSKRDAKKQQASQKSKQQPNAPTLKTPGIKPVRAIRPIRPIRPKGLVARTQEQLESIQMEFQNMAMAEILGDK